ncbi:MAG TPA: GTPase HflX [Bacteroidales bacterium]|nr:GTPase HflX [Bacteroidales bacterium]
MPKGIIIKPVVERAVLIGLVKNRFDADRINDYLNELAFLVDTAGGVAVKRFIQRIDLPDQRTYIGQGKLNEIKEFVKNEDINIAIFDDELTPSQSRNVEKELGIKVLDRNSLILDIFARRARTAHARTQVELAQYEYLLPRLTRMWTHLERQQGGIGLRGPGEREIETDRRIVRDRIALLKEKLKEIDKIKTTQRKGRKELVRVALVGYTNVGKSTVMNLLSKSDVFAENKLFATLDTTVRKVVIGNLPFLLTDTVGFIRKLPHSLVESFKSTLDEVREADLLVHIADISHPHFEEQIAVVNQTLSEIGASNKPVIMLFNKIDAYTFVEKDPFDLTPAGKENLSLDDLKKTWMSNSHYPSIFLSATQKVNLEEFKNMLYGEVRKIHTKIYPFNNFLFEEF